ncbi:uncharacterized protein CC84DRAFT_462424 [Paraphaeosphaeria sporulosa]|uniref:Uncharacterized protein n=1 Tax=Paraphaeosphaeria sporulosa TaxID=1460663 RepID=A0A177CRE0_9PLEO|nr:uncharacterized protein CC84DRAFT_462424 [Paraphaeosphaeria sporulosa]OAG10085.1 hypothetical protein CC84DRAFT_462424 [Paraphaeosphaeria sporulosa]
MQRSALALGGVCLLRSRGRQLREPWLDEVVVEVLQRRARRNRDETGALEVQGAGGITTAYMVGSGPSLQLGEGAQEQGRWSESQYTHGKIKE